MDVPKGPKLLGELVGRAIAEAGLQVGAIETLLENAEDVDPKREFAAAALLLAKVRLSWRLETLATQRHNYSAHNMDVKCVGLVLVELTNRNCIFNTCMNLASNILHVHKGWGGGGGL